MKKQGILTRLVGAASVLALAAAAQAGPQTTAQSGAPAERSEPDLLEYLPDPSLGSLYAAAGGADPGPWSGFYAGGSIGWAWGESEHYYDRAGHGWESTEPDGGAIALTGGYNHQFPNQLVVGLEADLGVMDVSADQKVIWDDHLYRTEWGDWFATFRGRAGYAYGDTLFFGTAGVAFIDSDEVVIGNTPQEGVSNERTIAAFVGGLGVEHRFWEDTSVKLEWLHFSMDEDSGVNVGPQGDDEAWSLDGRLDMLRVGVNFHI